MTWTVSGCALFHHLAQLIERDTSALLDQFQVEPCKLRSSRATGIRPLRAPRTFLEDSYPVIAEGLACLGSVESLKQPPIADGR